MTPDVSIVASCRRRAQNALAPLSLTAPEGGEVPSRCAIHAAPPDRACAAERWLRASHLSAPSRAGRSDCSVHAILPEVGSTSGPRRQAAVLRRGCGTLALRHDECERLCHMECVRDVLARARVLIWRASSSGASHGTTHLLRQGWGTTGHASGHALSRCRLAVNSRPAAPADLLPARSVLPTAPGPLAPIACPPPAAFACTARVSVSLPAAGPEPHPSSTVQCRSDRTPARHLLRRPHAQALHAPTRTHWRHTALGTAMPHRYLPCRSLGFIKKPAHDALAPRAERVPMVLALLVGDPAPETKLLCLGARRTSTARAAAHEKGSIAPLRARAPLL